MRTTKQMKVAKHMLAIWLKPGDKESFDDAMNCISSSWDYLPQRVLKSWVRKLYNDPSKYEFTGMSFKKLKTEDHFSPDECKIIENTLTSFAPDSIDANSIRRNIIICKWYKKMSLDNAMIGGFKAFYGNQYTL